MSSFRKSGSQKRQFDIDNSVIIAEKVGALKKASRPRAAICEEVVRAIGMAGQSQNLSG